MTPSKLEEFLELVARVATNEERDDTLRFMQLTSIFHKPEFQNVDEWLTDSIRLMKSILR